MICKPCRHGEHEHCPDSVGDGITATWCDCQHLPREPKRKRGTKKNG
jgi:hypothetical protein